MDFSPRAFLFTAATVQIPIHTAPKSVTENNRYVMLHFRDQRSAYSLRSRNPAEITVVMCIEALSGMVLMPAKEVSSIL